MAITRSVLTCASRRGREQQAEQESQRQLHRGYFPFADLTR